MSATRSVEHLASQGLPLRHPAGPRPGARFRRRWLRTDGGLGSASPAKPAREFFARLPPDAPLSHFATPARRVLQPGRAGPLFLMCRPTHYAIAYEINPWMHLNKPAARSRSLQQWHALYTLLTKRLKVRVQLLRPIQGLPDLVFTANAGLVHGRTLIRSNFRYPQRRGEEPAIEAYFTSRGFRVVTMPRRFNFEGEGDALRAGNTLFLGFRFRSDAKAHEWLAQRLHCRVLPLELADRRFYHLDTCFCPLSERAVLWYPEAFDRYGRRVIRSHFPDSLEVSTADARRFCCNAIVLPHDIVLHAHASSALRRQLERQGFAVHGVDLSEFLKAGGAAKCLALRLNEAGADRASRRG